MRDDLYSVIAELERRIAPRRKARQIYSSLFEEQKDVAECEERKVAILTSRRAGKSWTICCIMVMQCLIFPNSRCLYLALTRENIKRIAWEILQKLDKEYELNITFNKVSLTAVFSNGSSIECGGAKGTQEEAERYLGAAFNIVAIDEAGSFSFPLLKYLIDSVLIPTLIDARPQGKLYLTGTPRSVMKGIFYDATTKDIPGWSRFAWNTSRNPYTSRQYLEEIQELKAINPHVEEDPWFKREYLGQWAVEETELVYRFNPNINVINELPKQISINNYAYIAGVDIGWNDDCAFVVGCYIKNDPNFYIIDCFKKPQMLPDAIASQLQHYTKEYGEYIYIVADTGGGGSKTITQELTYRYNIQINAAEKTSKADWIEIINSDFVSGKIKIIDKACRPLITELFELTWKEKPNGDREENPALANHLCDAMLYAYRQAYHYIQNKPKEKPEVGSKEYWKAEEERLYNQTWQRVLRKRKQEREGF